MTIVRRVARPLLASIFISGGIDSVRNASTKAPAAEDVAAPIAARIPGLAEGDTELLVRVNGGVQVGAGALLALGRVPRLAALALSASLVPTTVAGHRFWEERDPTRRAQQQIHFLKNASMLGGLLLATADTGGAPSVTWRARHAADRAGSAGRRRSRLARRETRVALREARLAAREGASRLSA